MTNEKDGQLVAVRRVRNMHLANKCFCTRLCKESVDFNAFEGSLESSTVVFQCP